MKKYFPVKTEVENNENSANNPSDSNILKVQIFSKEIDNVEIELNIPYTWKYEEMENNSTETQYKYALKLYKCNVDKYATLCVCKNIFGVRGTDRKNKAITLNNGKKATIGYYSKSQN